MCGEGNAEGGGKNGTAFQDQASPLMCGEGNAGGGGKN